MKKLKDNKLILGAGYDDSLDEWKKEVNRRIEEMEKLKRLIRKKKIEEINKKSEI